MNEKYYNDVMQVGVEACIAKAEKLMNLHKIGDHSFDYWFRKYLPLFYYVDLMLRYNYGAGVFTDEQLKFNCEIILEISNS